MKTFKEIGLKEELLKAVEDLGFKTPTPIQAEAIPFLLENENADLIAVAQTGTGKTATFGLSILQNLEVSEKKVQAIILCPTRELCIQIARDIKSYSTYLGKIKTTAVYGGTNISSQIKALNRGTHIVVGTPGRTLDLINRRKLDLSGVQITVLDEADEMLSMGFKEDLESILSNAPKERTSLMFSATMPSGIKDLAQKHLQNAQTISVAQENVSARNVSHSYFLVNSRDRYKALKRIVDLHPDIYAIIFCRTRRETKEVAEWLSNDGYLSDALHGDLSQAQRDVVMNKFRKHQIQILVATDVASRGIDVNDITHVINYTLPDEIDVYVHRAGRTGRAGNEGESLILMTKSERRRLSQIEKKIGKKVDQKQIPSPKTIKQNQVLNFITQIEETVPEESDYLNTVMGDILDKLEHLDKEELLKRIVTMEFKKFIEYYNETEDLNANAEQGRSNRSSRDRKGRKGRRDRGDRDDRRVKNKSGAKLSSYGINLGKKQKFKPGDLIQLINRYMPRKDLEIGQINIHKSHTTFEFDAKHGKTLSKVMNSKNFKGVPIIVDTL